MFVNCGIARRKVLVQKLLSLKVPPTRPDGYLALHVPRVFLELAGLLARCVDSCLGNGFCIKEVETK